MIKPATISSFRADNNKENKRAADNETKVMADQVNDAIPSTSGVVTNKKLTSKPSRTDQVLTYLKALVCTSGSKRKWLTLLLTCHSGVHACCLLQDKVAAEIHNENRVYKKQLIGLLAKVQHISMHEVLSSSLVPFVQYQLCCIQMVGASPDEVEAMGKN